MLRNFPEEIDEQILPYEVIPSVSSNILVQVFSHDCPILPKSLLPPDAIEIQLNFLRGLFKAPSIVGRSASHSLNRRKSSAGSQKITRQKQDQDAKLQPRRAETFASGTRQHRQSSLDHNSEEKEEGENERGEISVANFSRLSVPSSAFHRPTSTSDIYHTSDSLDHHGECFPTFILSKKQYPGSSLVKNSDFATPPPYPVLIAAVGHPTHWVYTVGHRTRDLGLRKRTISFGLVPNINQLMHSYSSVNVTIQCDEVSLLRRPRNITNTL
ncbi:hypothetical protein ACTXT7_005660 [Hymenolepis weldensis]